MMSWLVVKICHIFWMPTLSATLAEAGPHLAVSYNHLIPTEEDFFNSSLKKIVIGNPSMFYRISSFIETIKGYLSIIMQT